MYFHARTFSYLFYNHSSVEKPSLHLEKKLSFHHPSICGFLSVYQGNFFIVFRGHGHLDSNIEKFSTFVRDPSHFLPVLFSSSQLCSIGLLYFNPVWGKQESSHTRKGDCLTFFSFLFRNEFLLLCVGQIIPLLFRSLQMRLGRD